MRRFGVPGWVLCLTVAWLMAAMGCAQEEVKRATVRVETDPPGAMVVMNEVECGEAPADVPDVEPGMTVVEAYMEGYKPATKLLDVPMDGGEMVVTLELEPQIGRVTFESEPDMAKVYLDGTEYLGETPLAAVPVPVGEHEYELVKSNFEPLRATIDVQEDYVYEQRHVLTPMRSTLSVITMPTAAEIWINEALQDQKTPARISLPPGRHTVAVHAKGYVTADEAVELGPNEQETIELRLEPGDVPPNMSLVPAGEFLMGSDEAPHERPPHRVFVDTFYMDRYEVTNQDFAAVFPGHTFPEGEELLPVAGVTWNQATEYAAAVGKRLPTEAEWEKAARGTEGRIYPWGNEFHPEWCNSSETFGAVPRKVGHYREGQSPYGCMDMAGNVYEWTSDWYRAYTGNQEISKDYGQLFRVLRGGSYLRGRFDQRCAARHYDASEAARDDYGFRCAKDAE